MNSGQTNKTDRHYEKCKERLHGWSGHRDVAKLWETVQRWVIRNPSQWKCQRMIDCWNFSVKISQFTYLDTVSPGNPSTKGHRHDTLRYLTATSNQWIQTAHNYFGWRSRQYWPGHSHSEPSTAEIFLIYLKQTTVTAT